MRISSLPVLAACAAVFVLSACGGKAVVESDPGSGGAAATTAVGATTGASAATSASATTGASVTTGGNSACGGLGGIHCAFGEYCDYPNDDCGGDDGQGACAPGPGGCPADCPGVCGCDGTFYCNECMAHAPGVDASGELNCGLDDGG